MLKRRCRTVTSYEGFKGRSSRGVDTLPTPSCLDYRHLLCPEDDVVGISFPLIWKKQSCAQAPQFLGDCFPRKHDFRIQENALKLCCSVWTHHQACSRHPWDVLVMNCHLYCIGLYTSTQGPLSYPPGNSKLMAIDSFVRTCLGAGSILNYFCKRDSDQFIYFVHRSN